MSTRLLALVFVIAGVAPTANAAQSGNGRSVTRGTAAQSGQRGRTVRPGRPAPSPRPIVRPIRGANRARGAIQLAVENLIRARTSGRLLPPAVNDILITGTRPGPGNSVVFDFDALVGGNWFRGIHTTVFADRQGAPIAGQLTFDSHFTDRDIASGDNTLELPFR